MNKIVAEKRKLLNIMVNSEELEAFKKKAKKYTKGNVSLWLRYSGMNHSPKPSELK